MIVNCKFIYFVKILNHTHLINFNLKSRDYDGGGRGGESYGDGEVCGNGDDDDNNVAIVLWGCDGDGGGKGGDSGGVATLS